MQRAAEMPTADKQHPAVLPNLTFIAGGNGGDSGNVIGSTVTIGDNGGAGGAATSSPPEVIASQTSQRLASPTEASKLANVSA